MLDKINKNLSNCVAETNWPSGTKHRGKVRDIYNQGDKLVLITTDRLSAFDRQIAVIPFKGQVLNLISAYWFKQTEDIVSNHFLSMPNANTMIVKKCRVFPVEFIVRGFITGTTSTSLWTQYNRGVRNYCGINFPEGLRKNQQLSTPVLTPTTKDAVHDRPLSAEDIIQQGLMSKKHWQDAKKIALQLYARGVELAAKRGLILVDTKYEMGLDENGNITLIDEVHTPDSSRYWLNSSYQERFSFNQEPENFDKEILRRWYAKHCDPYNDKDLPLAPEELVIELSSRYIKLYEMITGKVFTFGN